MVNTKMPSTGTDRSVLSKFESRSDARTFLLDGRLFPWRSRSSSFLFSLIFSTHTKISSNIRMIDSSPNRRIRKLLSPYTVTRFCFVVSTVPSVVILLRYFHPKAIMYHIKAASQPKKARPFAICPRISGPMPKIRYDSFVLASPSANVTPISLNPFPTAPKNAAIGFFFFSAAAILLPPHSETNGCPDQDRLIRLKKPVDPIKRIG